MKMFKQEWKQLFSKPLLIGTMLVMMFIPIIYGGFFLGSSWDPYGKTDRLPVAVVNQDKAAEFEGQTLSVGEELVDNLKGNEDLEWHFTDAKEAERGMEEGKYFMTLTIPEDFSFNATTAMGMQPKPMNLQYETNPGRGFFIEAVSKQATADIREQISESVTKEYVQAVFSQIQTIGEGMNEASEGAGQLGAGAGDLQTGNNRLSAGLSELASGTLTFRDGADKLEVGVGQFAEGVNQLSAGAGQLREGVFAYTSGVGSLQSGIAGLADGSIQLSENGTALVQGSEELANGIGALVPGAAQLNAGLYDAQSGSGKLDQGLHELQAKTSQLAGENSSVQQLADGQKGLDTGLKELQTGSASLEQGLASLQGSLPDNGQIEALQAGLAGIQENAAKLNAAASGGSSGGSVSELQGNLAEAQQILEELKNAPSASAVEAVQNTEAYNSLTPELQAELAAAVQQSADTQAANQQANLEALSAKLSAATAGLNEKILPAYQSLGSLPELTAGLNSAVAQVNPGASKALGGYAAIREALSAKLIPGAGSLNDGLAEASAASGQLTEGTSQMAATLPQLAGAVDSLAQGSTALNEGVSSLASGSNELVDGANALKSGSASLTQGAAAYTDGVAELAEGAGRLKAGSDELASNSAQLESGADELANGTVALKEGVPALAEGAKGLSGGAGSLNEGAGALEEGAGELGAGIGKLKAGSNELAGSLEEGAEEINGTQLTDANYEMIAAPASATESQLSKVPNYGHALAPYILSLGLYVGALSFNLVFPLNQPAGRPTSGAAWWFSKFSLGFIQATASALIVDAIMLFGFNLQVEHIAEFIAISIATSLAYMFLIMFLSITLGNPGRFLAMIILVLQLGASGGMFPVELTNSFFQKVHDFVPMSYALLGFREAMSSAYGTETFMTSMEVLGGFMVLCNILLWLVLSRRSRKILKTAEAN